MTHVEFPGLGLAFDVNPVAFTIGSFEFRWYGILIALGFILAFLYALKICKRYQVNQDHLIDCIIAGLILGARSGAYSILVNAGIFCFSLAVLFQLITLPVEFNASHRALVLLQDQGILYADEAAKTRKVLSAAALTYVAGALSSMLQLLRLIILFGNRSRRD